MDTNPPPTKKDYRVGMMFGSIVLRRKLKNDSKGRIWWSVQCLSCGKKFQTRQYYLYRKPNPLTHCGCLNAGGLPSQHPRLYSIWYMMNRRCNEPSHEAYIHYGGRGIKVCEEWLQTNPEGFANFVRDMGEPTSEKHTLDRRDNDQGYRKENCRWATAKEQRANQRPRQAKTPFVATGS